MSHLTLEQRYTISRMLAMKKTQNEIAKVIEKHKSVVSREIRRNCDKRSGEYRHDLAQRKCEQRHYLKPKRILFDEHQKVYVNQKLRQKYSPEQIVGEAKLKGLYCVSHERIYQYVWDEKRKSNLICKHLRTRGKKYKKRGSGNEKRGILKDRVDICQRPAIVEDKIRFGDLEIDTIIGKNHKGAILTINDRATGVLKMCKLSGKNAEELARATIETLKDWKPYLHTITSDNGKEFANHETISNNLEIEFYFAKPFHSWQRGANENLNGLIRQYIPKKTEFDKVTNHFIKYVENELNNRPRKRHNFMSPIQKLNQKLVAFIT